MAQHLIFGRTEYAEPLALVTAVDTAATPTLDDLDVGTGWLELVVVPEAAAIWMLRDGEPVERAMEARVSATTAAGSRMGAGVGEPAGGEPLP